jgi:hypothetical protein
MITVYGASDDLIEVDGDISAEFAYQKRGYGQPSGDLLAFSDGTILRVEFTRSGVWRITPVVRGSAELSIDQAPENDEDNRSDRATVSGAVWVAQSIDYATVAGVSQWPPR